MTAISAIVDRSDLPQVSPSALALPLQHMMDAGRGLVLLRGISDREFRDIEQAVWDEVGDNSGERVAALLRFRCLVGVFKSPRLQELFLRRGLALIPDALEVAAAMRLNVQWGFNPVKFTRVLEARLAQADDHRAARRMQRAASIPMAQVAMA